jgi:16S rRNA (adenine(1408)-N(1))-methyltransferase
VAIDLGTGDGRFVLATAAACPGTLAIGVDASLDAMVEASRHASRPARKGGLPNALFVVAAAEALPSELDGVADAVTVQFPWGSLLRGLLCGDAAILSGIARVTRPDAGISLLVSVTERDRASGLPALGEWTFGALAPVYAEHGLLLRGYRAAGAEEVAASHSTWAKRLKVGAERAVWSVRLERAN